jgi:hypothetical protein
VSVIFHDSWCSGYWKSITTVKKTVREKRRFILVWINTYSLTYQRHLKLKHSWTLNKANIRFSAFLNSCQFKSLIRYKNGDVYFDTCFLICCLFMLVFNVKCMTGQRSVCVKCPHPLPVVFMSAICIISWRSYVYVNIPKLNKLYWLWLWLWLVRILIS